MSYKSLLTMIIIGLLLCNTSCATQEKTRPWVDLAKINAQVEKAKSQNPVLDAADQEQAKGERVKDMSSSEPVANDFLAGQPTAAQLQAEEPKDGILLNFDNTDIYEFVQIIAQTLEINYIVDPKVKGVVNIRSGRKVGKDKLFDVFRKILHINGLDVRSEGDYYYIYPAKGATPQKLLGPEQIDSLKDSSRMVLQIIPVVHLASSEAEKLITPYLSEAGAIHNLSNQNTLIVHDFESKIIDAVTMLAKLDISPLAALKIRLVRVENAPLFDLRDELQEILGALGVNPKDHEAVSLIPLERVNSLLMVSKSEQLLDNTDRWIKELDVVPSEGRDNIFFYNVRNSVASELAALVSALIDGDVTPLTNQTKSPVKKAAGDDPKTMAAIPAAGNRLTNTAPSTSTLRFAGKPVLMADDSRNIILLRALMPDYSRLVKLLERLDNMPRQVLIEVLVAEVKLTDTWEFGVEWALKNNQLNFNNSNYKQTVGTNFTAVANNAVGGLTYAVFNSASDVIGLINALASETDVSLLSSPQVLVLNNEQATVNVGDQVPIVTTETQQTGESTAVDKTVQYKDTGTILTVTPRINYNGVIILDIDQQVSQATETTSSTINSPTISTRKLKTKLAVKDGQTILMGGLISKNLTKNQNSVPILGDIPILGWLFKYEKEVDTKTELLVMITPYVIESEDVLDQYIKKFKAKMDGIRQELVEKR
ncbi:MAG: type II secretion system secretin GspD [Desulfobulbaceae bacterium]|nr:type II secretion system secretin GspD [Desulfobulbaceae bacterium]HIJ78348.1 type II secretion system secretin GspD [Deltaproteobacteria bacterium]